jgi:TPR repeat protein
MLAEPTRKPTEAVVIPLPTEPMAPDRLAEKAMGDEQPTPAKLLARGGELLAVSDVASARLFFARGAAQGNTQAMTAMASTYDPLMLASRNVRGVHPEPRQAISWYRRAAAAGDATAEGRLRALIDVLRTSGQIDASESAALLRVGEEGP